MIALAILVAPVALFGLLHKTRLHFIGIQYKTSGDNTGGILLQGDKDNYRAMIVALQGVTGFPPEAQAELFVDNVTSQFFRRRARRIGGPEAARTAVNFFLRGTGLREETEV